MAFKDCTKEEMLKAYKEAQDANPGMTSLNLLIRIAADNTGARPSDIRAAVEDTYDEDDEDEE